MSARVKARAAAAGVLLAGPFVLAFRSGGYFDQPRIVAAIAVWLLVAVAAATAPQVLPRDRAGRLAVGGLAALAVWTLLSWDWAPLEGPAQDDLQRLVLYLGTLIAAAALLRGREWLRRLEVTIAFGALVVIGYALFERLVPWAVTFDHSVSAGGRLEQPLTYWNATGLMAAMGMVACARLAGDDARSARLRAAAAAAAAPLGTGIYLSFSRGALAALFAGLVVLIATVRTREQARAAVLVVAVGLAPAMAAAGLDGFRAYDASRDTREAQGLLMILVLVACSGWAVAASFWLRAAEARRRLRTGTLLIPTGVSAPALAVAAVLALGGVVALTAASDSAPRSPAFGATSARFGSLESHRYQYWRVALRTFAHHPVQGAGSGAFRVEWQRHRTVGDLARDAHSLYLETAAELGLAGLLALAAFLGGVAAAARRALREDVSSAAGAVAILAAWAVHAGLDWDWEMPAVTLPALVVAGALVARAAGGGGLPSSGEG